MSRGQWQQESAASGCIAMASESFLHFVPDMTGVPKLGGRADAQANGSDRAGLAGVSHFELISRDVPSGRIGRCTLHQHQLQISVNKSAGPQECEWSLHPSVERAHITVRRVWRRKLQGVVTRF